jgi:hypothetical protein
LGFPGITLGFEKTLGSPKTRGIPGENIENPGFEINAGSPFLKNLSFIH